ncbi:MAG: pyrroloquinoline-quinone synthase, partial [Verrucomicrobiota bacterium]
MNEHIEKIDNQIEAKHLLKHPFYLAWTRGELSREALTDYARQYYHHVAAFPTYLSAVHAKCDDQATRKQLLDNLVDEEAGSPNHPDLWKKFAEGLGVEDIDLAQAAKQPETKNLIGTFRSVCGEGSTAEGLAALYA